MLKRRVASYLSIIFMLFLSAPMIIIIVDDSIDISVFYASAEEEDNGLEKNKDIEVLFSEYIINGTRFFSSQTKNNIGYYLKKYSKPHLNLISPPPEYL